jgi:hypothetical protein
MRRGNGGSIRPCAHENPERCDVRYRILLQKGDRGYSRVRTPGSTVCSGDKEHDVGEIMGHPVGLVGLLGHHVSHPARL